MKHAMELKNIEMKALKEELNACKGKLKNYENAHAPMQEHMHKLKKKLIMYEIDCEVEKCKPFWGSIIKGIVGNSSMAKNMCEYVKAFMERRCMSGNAYLRT